MAGFNQQVGNAFPDLFFHSRESGICKRHSQNSQAPGNDVRYDVRGTD